MHGDCIYKKFLHMKKPPDTRLKASVPARAVADDPALKRAVMRGLLQLIRTQLIVAFQINIQRRVLFKRPCGDKGSVTDIVLQTTEPEFY